MKRLTWIMILMSLCIAGFVQGQDTSDRDPMKAEDLPDLYEGPRDPFWPIGERPIKKLPPVVNPASTNGGPVVVEPPKFVPKWPALKVTGINGSEKTGYLAIIENVGLVEEGQIFAIVTKEARYTWLVEKITKQGCSFKQRIAKPLKK